MNILKNRQKKNYKISLTFLMTELCNFYLNLLKLSSKRIKRIINRQTLPLVFICVFFSYFVNFKLEGKKWIILVAQM